MQTKNNKGQYVPMIPLPFYGIKKYCECGKSFWFEENYEAHYALEHIIRGN